MKFAFQTSCLHRFLTGTHLICITTDRIDLSVVDHKAVRMRSLPARCSIRTESGMYHCNCRNKFFVLQIFKEKSQLSYKEHSFVNDCSAGKRNNISVITALFKNSSDYIQSTIKINSSLVFCRTFNKCLHNTWHAVYCCLSKNVRMNRNFSPAQELQSFFFYNNLENLFRLIAF